MKQQEQKLKDKQTALNQLKAEKDQARQQKKHQQRDLFQQFARENQAKMEQLQTKLTQNERKFQITKEDLEKQAADKKLVQELKK